MRGIELYYKVSPPDDHKYRWAIQRFHNLPTVMAKPKFKESIFFVDHNNETRFLFQVLNLGKGVADELKFVFTHPNSGMGGIHMDAAGQFTGDEIIRLQSEISYHADGSLLQKMPSYSPRADTIYKNPHGTGQRRTPLANIYLWEPFLKYTVVDYLLCRKPVGEDAIFVSHHSGVFDGTSFACLLFLGNEEMPNPRIHSDRGVFRLPGVASKLDLLCCFYKSDYQGEYFTLPNSSRRVFVRRNMIEIVVRRNNTGFALE